MVDCSTLVDLQRQTNGLHPIDARRFGGKSVVLYICFQEHRDIQYVNRSNTI